MNKLEKIIGTEVFSNLPVTLQLTEGKEIQHVFHFSMKATNSAFHQTHERSLTGNFKPISKIVKPINESDATELF